MVHDFDDEDHQPVVAMFGDCLVVSDAIVPVVAQLVAQVFAEPESDSGDDIIRGA